MTFHCVVTSKQQAAPERCSLDTHKRTGQDDVKAKVYAASGVQAQH
jgi:hypothetical protein